MTPRVSWVVGWSCRGAQQEDNQGLWARLLVLHAAGAPQIAALAMAAYLMLRHPSQTLCRSAVAEVCDRYSSIAFVTSGPTAFLEMIDLTHPR